MRIPTDPQGLEGFANDLARQLQPLSLLYLAELLSKHAGQRRSGLTPEQQWLESRGIRPQDGWPET